MALLVRNGGSRHTGQAAPPQRNIQLLSELPQNIIPSVDMIRSQLHEATESNVVYFKNEVPITTTDLSKYDEKCGVAVR